MKRMHLHVNVDDLNQSIAFYSVLFGAKPAVVKDDYAKWMMEDPRLNFAISARGRALGLDHLGIQAEVPSELSELAGRLKDAGAAIFEETDTSCCYARSDKAWVKDPSGIAWETFYTFGQETAYGESEALETMLAKAEGGTCMDGSTSCCGPATAQGQAATEHPRADPACC